MCQRKPLCGIIKERVERQILVCRGNMTQEQVTQLYTGSHWKVEAATLSEIEHFSRFAVCPPVAALTLLPS